MEIIARLKRVVITGGPGCGKSTVIAELGRKGHLVIPEVFRWLKVVLAIESFDAKNPRPAPGREPLDLLLGFHRFVEDEDAGDGFCFYDRCLLDLVAFTRFYTARARSEEVSERLALLDRHAQRVAARIHKAFLLALPETGISQDWLRNDTLGEARLLESAIRQTYEQHKVPLIQLPRKEPAALCGSILRALRE